MLLRLVIPPTEKDYYKKQVEERGISRAQPQVSLLILTFLLSGVPTDFWNQNSRLSPDVFQKLLLIFQTRGYQTDDQRRPLKNAETKLFSVY